MPRTTDPITLATARKMALTSLSGVESRLAAEREYVSHDPHTVALLQLDALERLERWLRPVRGRWATLELCAGDMAIAILVGPGTMGGVQCKGDHLSAAIHDALDLAEAKP